MADTFSFTQRLKEIDRFFQGRSPIHQTMRRLARKLEEAETPYAIIGGMAVNAHGHAQTTDDVDLLLTLEGRQKLFSLCIGEFSAPPKPRRGRFLYGVNHVPVDIVLAGQCPSRYGAKPIAYPEPSDAVEVIGGIRYLSLVWLIQVKLAARRYRDLGDVTALIRVHNLDESFLEKIHPAVHRDFIECLEEKRREDEYEARED
jgi:hypothetical protein